MATVTVTLSPAREDALVALAAAGRPCLIADMTRLHAGHVGWQQAHWLCSQGYAVRDGNTIRLTGRGRILCGYLHLTVTDPLPV
jgi:hypothetical protein